ncbi:hypothetical protein AAIR98_001434 [Elusimicrobium simillimum]|uniref:hypothetical protein n=1 Tax=Elusimicrobium simillimum TaxID=3143438 RepID=UPI003C6F82AC
MQYYPLQASLSKGEIDISLWVRNDLAIKTSAVKKALNFYVRPQGGMANRPGTRMYHRTKNGTDKIALIPFTFNKDQVFELEFGHEYVRFYTPDGLVVKEKENPDDLDVPYEILSPFTEADLENIYYHQTADVFYIACLGKRPYELHRRGNLDWVFTEYPYKGGPFLNTNTDETIRISVFYKADSGYKIKASTNYFTEMHTGAYFRVRGDVQGQIKKETFNSTKTSSQYVLAKSEWKVKTAGDWTGKLFLEKSANRVEWSTVATFTNDSDGNNANSFGDTGEDSLVWLRLRYEYTSGECVATLSVDTFKHYNIVKIVKYWNPTECDVTIENGVTGIHELFTGNGVDIVKLTPDLTGVPQQDPGVVGGDGNGYKNGQLVYFGVYLGMSGDLKDRADGTYWEYEFWNDGRTKYAVNTIAATFLKGQSDYLDIELLIWTNNGWENLGKPHNGWRLTLGKTQKLCQWDFAPVQITKFRFKMNTGESLSCAYANGTTAEQGLGTTDWAEGAWSDAQGYPTSVYAYQGRVCWVKGRSAYTTEVENYESFARNTPLLDSDGATIALKSQNDINAIVGLKRLVLLTQDGAYVTSTDELTPATSAPRQNSYGGSKARPVIIGDKIVYAQSQGNVLREISYSLQNDSFGGDDLRLLAPHLFKGKQIAAMEYQQEPNSLLWVMFSDGSMAVMTYLREQDILAWTRFETDGKVENINVNSGGDHDDLWLSVRRGGILYVEKMEQRLKSNKPEDQFFVDCGVTFEFDEAVNEVSGLGHLEGKGVAVVADGYVIRDAPKEDAAQGEWLKVTDGKIKFPNGFTAKKIHAGLPYNCRIESLSFGETGTDGSTSSRSKSVAAVDVWVVDTIGGYVGTRTEEEIRIAQFAEEKLYPFEGRRHFDKPAEMVSGFKTQEVSCSSGKEVTLIVEQPDPMPMEVGGFVLHLNL